MHNGPVSLKERSGDGISCLERSCSRGFFGNTDANVIAADHFESTTPVFLSYTATRRFSAKPFR